MKKITSLALGLALMASVGFFGAHSAHAQYTAPSGGTTAAPTGTVTTPGVPTTGKGGEAAANALMLLASGVVAVGGVTYLFKRVAVAK